MPSPTTPQKSPRRTEASYGFPQLSPSLGLQEPIRARKFSRRETSPPRRSPQKASLKRQQVTDRFIPNRHASWLAEDWATAPASAGSSTAGGAAVAGRSYSSGIGAAVGGGAAVSAHRSQSDLVGASSRGLAEACGVRTTRVLEFQRAAPHAGNPLELHNRYHHAAAKPALAAAARRAISSVPERVLDAPGIVDDYYLNLVDWSTTNELAIALEDKVYVWNGTTGDVACLAELGQANYVSSLRWSADGYLAVGSSDGEIQIWDAESRSKLRSMLGRSSRVAALDWNTHMLTSGARDGGIWQHDVRVRDHGVAQLWGHTAEVCGLAWRGDGAQLASGGNDNLLNIWDARSSVPKFSKTNHTAAVKALAWCPWQRNLLATGGGLQDRHIHFWNTASGSRVNTVDTGAQVASLHWSPYHREIASCHGYPSNEIALWSYPTLQRTARIDAHRSRILSATLSPDGQTIASCAADENLKFWKVFESQGRRLGATIASSEVTKSMLLR